LFWESVSAQTNENQCDTSGIAIASLEERMKPMKRLYAKLINGEDAEVAAESNPSLTGLLAAFLCGVLCAMLIHWLMF
jgi:hypothetical protein